MVDGSNFPRTRVHVVESGFAISSSNFFTFLALELRCEGAALTHLDSLAVVADKGIVVFWLKTTTTQL
jgi:hypothetical protein